MHWFRACTAAAQRHVHGRMDCSMSDQLSLGPRAAQWRLVQWAAQQCTPHPTCGAEELHAVLDQRPDGVQVRLAHVELPKLTDGGAAECGGTLGSGTVCGWEGGAACTWLNGAWGSSRGGGETGLAGGNWSVEWAQSTKIGRSSRVATSCWRRGGGSTPESRSRTVGAPPVVDAKPHTHAVRPSRRARACPMWSNRPGLMRLSRVEWNRSLAISRNLVGRVGVQLHL